MSRPHVSIEQATGADVEAVHALDDACFGVDAWSQESVRTALTGPHRHALLAHEGEELVGYAISMLGGDVLDLQRIAVAPGHRRSGLARVLFDRLCQEGAAGRAQRLMLEVSEANASGRAFYEACGLTEVARRPAYYRDGSAALVMELPLTPEDEDVVEAHLARERTDVAELAELAEREEWRDA
ncbi:GNAT family N-acetyltransferase [Nocardioides sp. HDW12B]|uniref:GNAT family N-acetyltransferase n=1 Tax=Nocardioides sp. HDW12B TaxID=2714939 RepID=UPI00140D8B63|nr:GNAT family N-acetyltransferase [Nocardioides sp. HDW12B]QIK65436.1 GNAT family N-acetyltransferase [Nocardioides sp. HDW12B]